MSRQANSPKQAAASRRNAAAATADAPGATRRDLLARLRFWVPAGLIGGGITYWIASDVMASIDEHDLSKIGNGVPAVVQIHDPNCPTCAALMRETRKALGGFEDGELQYLVANIRHDSGRQLARAHGVGHVTLLLFDGGGTMRRVLAGPSSSSRLEHAFREHLRQGRSGSGPSS